MNRPVEILHSAFTVLRASADTPVPAFVLQTLAWSVTRTDQELSILCDSHCIPADFTAKHMTRVDGYRGLRIARPPGFSELGMLAPLLQVLARANISVLTLSTFDIDYLFVAGEKFEAACHALRADGFNVSG